MLGLQGVARARTERAARELRAAWMLVPAAQRPALDMRRELIARVPSGMLDSLGTEYRVRLLDQLVESEISGVAAPWSYDTLTQMIGARLETASKAAPAPALPPSAADAADGDDEGSGEESSDSEQGGSSSSESSDGDSSSGSEDAFLDSADEALDADYRAQAGMRPRAQAGSKQGGSASSRSHNDGA